MSLINRMLQDLDARSTDGTANSDIHGHVRAVAESSKIHVGWWIALAAAVALLVGGGAIWFFYKPARPIAVPVSAAAQVPPPSMLSLKIAPDLTVAPLPATPKPVTEPQPPGAEIVAPVEAKPAEKKAAASQAREPAAILARPSPLPKKAEPDGMPSVPAAKAASPATPKLEEPPPVVLNKQIKEPTPQQRAENEYRRATSLMQQGKIAETIEVLEQVLLLDPQHGAARQTLIGLLVDSKRVDDAMRKMREGLDLDPNQPGLAMILARRQVEKGELRPAVETLQKTLPYALERADYHAFLAALLQRQANHKEAVEHYFVALRKTPQNGVWWMGLGISLQAENRVPEAQDAFGRAKASNSLSPELKAFVEQKLGQLQR